MGLNETELPFPPPPGWGSLSSFGWGLTEKVSLKSVPTSPGVRVGGGGVLVTAALQKWRPRGSNKVMLVSLIQEQ